MEGENVFMVADLAGKNQFFLTNFRFGKTNKVSLGKCQIIECKIKLKFSTKKLKLVC
jgi:hypothetical protein